jgi:KDO2-lipid IV(A) lauroyltransferase
MHRPIFRASLLHPRYWLTWLGMGVWWLIVQLLPLPLQVQLGKILGNVLLKLGGSRPRIASINIEKCYPELSDSEKKDLLRKTMQETAIGFFESGAAWFWPNWRFKGKYDINGKEHIERALKENKGVLFLGIHFTTIEIGASIVNLEFPISGFYRPHRNAVYEYIQAAGRVRRNPLSTVIPNGDVRGIVKTLRGGGVINYAPDQDYGRNRSVFAEFFGISTATVKAPAHLASAGRAEIIPWVTSRDPITSRYTIDILAPLALGKDDLENAQIINQYVEEEVRKNPHQYLWVHRRFKTRPEGEPGFYE